MEDGCTGQRQRVPVQSASRSHEGRIQATRRDRRGPGRPGHGSSEMKRAAQKALQIIAAVAAVVVGLFASDNIRFGEPYSPVSTAEARIGRPLTPMSYAGVARRTTRR